mmetsp:Transcript_47412/g.78944  ORF Transcript_47412/g.78944 Transcript_47412/m.78944 type:complete len:231 (+) Transcript_47412:181-873(+)|eukprot:CAMPEP_0184361424 /NCGR_PEP_ID=MMETSP1089-20130417/130208_1 /TAXON_ID=38269 ORGANISM="Gloeochaete wittrockiana, Strain SAG46.84" /NCGR_SAMPLE_ID=MMETSP1089 /ASSEMBLY_ACC=CAM_ASM_000445 /LENGTH=230 /DNA_ID=CAMNT_0026701079 /DNA_START=107 /DNA_END=799 /DNA_ORIENTATION=-
MSAVALSGSRQAVRTFGGIKCLVYLPKGFPTLRETSFFSPKKFPVILFLHGAGEYGTNCERVRRTGLPEVLDRNPFPFAEFPFVVISPQWNGEAEKLSSVLDSAKQELKHVDDNRVYITGISMGGFGCFHASALFPDRFAAMIPICGGMSANPSRQNLRLAERIRRIPAWLFHGARDETVSPEYSSSAADTLRKVGNPVQLTIYSDMGHDCWTATYEDHKIYEWLLRYSR